MRRSPLEEGRRWLDQAGEDLRWAEDLAERFLYAQGQEIVLGHSIERLCHTASQIEPEFGDRVKRWAIYPNSLPDSIPARVYTREAAAVET
jgi:hypothetical protein